MIIEFETKIEWNFQNAYKIPWILSLLLNRNIFAFILFPTLYKYHMWTCFFQCKVWLESSYLTSTVSLKRPCCFSIGSRIFQNLFFPYVYKKGLIQYKKHSLFSTLLVYRNRLSTYCRSQTYEMNRFNWMQEISFKSIRIRCSNFV